MLAEHGSPSLLIAEVVLITNLLPASRQGQPFPGQMKGGAGKAASPLKTKPLKKNSERQFRRVQLELAQVLEKRVPVAILSTLAVCISPLWASFLQIKRTELDMGEKPVVPSRDLNWFHTMLLATYEGCKLPLPLPFLARSALLRHNPG